MFPYSYADDLAAVIDPLDLNDAVLVGHSTGGGEISRYVGRHGTKRVTGLRCVGREPVLSSTAAARAAGGAGVNAASL